MMKPEDDLRKDNRIMELHSVVNQYLRQNPDARERNLNIRTYSVLALNESHGIIEWVSKLEHLADIIDGKFTNLNFINNIFCQNQFIHIFSFHHIEYQEKKTIGGVSSAELNLFGKMKKSADKLKWFKDTCSKHPPVLSEWFFDRFSTPCDWYKARSAYVRTTAVMSIVGYILGLGDRHCENILLDAKNGDIVHVDYDCLFNKAEAFEVPEVVPFRLTRNMVKTYEHSIFFVL